MQIMPACHPFAHSVDGDIKLACPVFEALGAAVEGIGNAAAVIHIDRMRANSAQIPLAQRHLYWIRNWEWLARRLLPF